MPPLTFLTFDASCPICGALHRVSCRSSIAGAEELRLGDRVELGDLGARGFLAATAYTDGPLRILDGDSRCGDQNVFTEIAIAEGLIAELKLVRCDRAALDRAHYVCPADSSLWEWARGLPDPAEWSHELYTADPIQRLRTKLLLVEVLPARDMQELELFLELIGCAASSSPEPIAGTDHWRLSCATPHGTIVLALQLLNESGASKILPADVFRRKADALAETVPVHAVDLPRSLALQTRHDLIQAIDYLEQLRAYVPPGEEHVPATAFWSESALAERAAHADRYARARIDATIARWRAELEQFGVRHAPRIRSAEEAYVVMAIHPCPRCGAETPPLASTFERRGDELVSIYRGPCGCDLVRHFEFRLPDKTPVQSAGALDLGEGLSQCLDPGQLMIAVDLFARRSDRYSLQLATAALDEILAFVPDGADRVPEDAITSRAGWAVFEAGPERFRASRLRNVRESYLGVAATLGFGA